jgi:hypothetical protein
MWARYMASGFCFAVNKHEKVKKSRIATVAQQTDAGLIALKNCWQIIGQRQTDLSNFVLTKFRVDNMKQI